MYEKYEALKKKFGVTDYRVAKETGIAQATLSAWKSGEYTPKADKLALIADFFGVTLDELWRG